MKKIRSIIIVLLLMLITIFYPGFVDISKSAYIADHETNDGIVYGSMNLELINTRDDGGTYEGIWANESYAYVCRGYSGISAYNVSGTTINLLDTHDDGGDYNDVWSDGTYIYVSSGSDILVYTFDGSTLSLLYSYALGGFVGGISGDGTYIYITNGASGIHAFTFNGTALNLNTTLSDSSYTSVYFAGSYIFTGYGAGLKAISFNENSTEEFWVKNTTIIQVCGDIWSEDGTYVYVADAYTYDLKVYSFDGTSFALLDTVAGTVAHIYGNFVTYGDLGLRFYGFDGADLSLINSVDDGGGYVDIWSAGDYVYLSLGGLGLRVYYFAESFNVTRTVTSITESNNFSFVSPNNYSFNATLRIPVSNDVRGILDVTNNTDNELATEVNTSGELVNNTFWYDSANQFVYIRTINISHFTESNWTINCSYGATFSLIIPSFLEVGQYFHSEGFISDANGDAISGMIAETRLLYANGTDALSVNPKHNCTNGNYKCTFSTSTLLPGTYSVSIEFTDPTSGIVFKEGDTLYLSTDPGSGIYISTFLHFTFYNNNTGIGIPSESFKIYSSIDTTIDSTDRIYVDLYGVYTGQTIYYRVDDYFDNQIYPLSGDYETLAITSINQFEDIPIDWYSFSVKNMNHSIVKFKMTNDSTTYTQFLFPYEPFYWDVLSGEYTINLTYYNAVTDVIEDYNEENITISSDTYYWIRGYDLRDIILEIQITNSSLDSLIISVTANVNISSSSIGNITTTIISNLTATETNITNLINSYSSNFTIIESVVGFLNNTVWTNFTVISSVVDTINNKLTINFDLLNVTVDYINNTIWTEFDAVNSNIGAINNSIHSTISIVESNLTSLNNNIWNAINITDSIVDNLNNNIWTNLTLIETTVDNINNNIWINLTIIESNIGTLSTSMHSSISLTETNLTTLNNNIWNAINITDSIVSYVNSTIWNELNFINNNISWMNSTTTYINDTIWNNFTIVGEDIIILNISIHNAIDLSELNLTALNINIWNDFNLTDAIIGYLNNTIWNNFTIVDAVIDSINNKLTIDFDLLNVTVDYINNTIWTEITAVNSNIGTVSTLIHSSIVASESNITAINNNVWNAINITDSVVDYINNTIWNEISLVNVTVDYLNNTIWTNLSLIDSDIDTLSVSVHTNLEVSETNISNIVYNVWSSLNLSNATVDYLNASIWNEIDIINSNLNYTNLSIKNMIVLTENNITTLLITIDNIIDYALMPDIEIVTCNPPMIFSVYDKEGMAIGVNIYKICPALITIATTRVETTGNWINSTAKIPGNNTVTNGTVTILSDELYISGSGTINWVNITYTDNGTLYQNTTYIPSKINLYGQNLTINASGDIHILRETQYNQLKKFYWTYYSDTGRHTAGIDIINSMDVPMYDVYNYVEFSNQSTPDPTTVVMRDVSNAGVVLKSGEHYDITSVGIHFYLLSISSDSTRGFTFEYYKRFDDAYRYGEETINVPGFIVTTWNGLSFNKFDVGWINNDNTIFRGGLFVKLGFKESSDINPSSVRIWDENNNHELNESEFISGSGFIRIDASGLGDINPGGGRRFSVYFLLEEYPDASPGEIHLNTPIWMGITPFLIILLVGLGLIGYGAYCYMYKNKKDWKNGVVIGGFIIFIFSVMAYMGV